MAKANVLVVEDERIIALELKDILKNLGHDVITIVSSGEEAVAKAGELEPDLILMDIMLQGEMDGIEAAAQIIKYFDIPIIYLTAYSGDELLARARQTEFYGYLIKPFCDRELDIAIQMALNKHSIKMKLCHT